MTFRWVLLFLLFIYSVEAKENVFWSLKGHLDREALTTWQEQAYLLSQEPPKVLAIAIESSSADLNALLELAQSIYSLKVQKKVHVVVYINGKALGPSAILPFLADEIFSSLSVSWGDIPLSAENKIPTNILSNQVIGLIAVDAPFRDTLILLAKAMIDPNVIVIDDKGWKLKEGREEGGNTQISVSNQTLVINQTQMQKLGLVKSALAWEEFQKNYPFKSILPREKAPVNQPFQTHITYSLEKKNTIGKIKIDDRSSGISQATWVYVRNALEYYKKNPPIFIILELNTPGGEVFAAQRISDALKDFDIQYNIPVITFINNWAISAGAMLAYSTRFITVTKDASMGAAEPITQDASGAMQTASEKVNSALRTDFANRAKFFGRNPAIAEAMVDKDVILVLRHGKVIRLDAESQIRTLSPDPDVLISPKGKLLTLNAEELINYHVADLLLTPRQLPPITPTEREAGKWAFNKELLSENAYLSAIPNAEVDEYIMDWKTRFFSFLASPFVQSALFLGLMLGFYLEINSPGFGFPGGLALISLALIILSSFSQELASWFEVILLFSGLAIVLTEIFILPSFGLLGCVGIALFLIGLFSLMLPGIGSINFEYDTQTFNAAGEAFFTRLAWLSATFVLALILMYLLARYFMPTFGGFQRFVLKGHEQEASQGYIAGLGVENLPKVGIKGKALTQLRPSGKILVGQNIYDALSTGRYIDQDASIIVIRLEGSVIVVTEDIK
ncbi:Uncharacterized protein PHSC3_001317 [Chlamydiales bacterium STE3]|nr:Uncharacterized protein PHSC3_001317 [Chlamydiales bacterium STE3]